MKRICVLLLLLTFTFSLVACGGGGGSESAVPIIKEATGLDDGDAERLYELVVDSGFKGTLKEVEVRSAADDSPVYRFRADSSIRDVYVGSAALGTENADWSKIGTTGGDIMHDGFIGFRLIDGSDLPTTLFGALYIGGFVVCIAAGYLLGSINTAIILSHVKYGADIRSSGSGNAGMTNVLRTYGAGSAGVTLAGDATKTLIAYIVGTLIFGIRGAYFACFMCVVGHIFPIYYKFKGGKGIVCAGMMILLLDPLAFLIILAVFIIVLIGFKYVSLASIMAAMIYPMAHSWMLPYIPSRIWPGSTAFAVVTAVLVLWRHYPNMKRLLNRTESKIDFAKLFGKKKEKSDGKDKEKEKDKT